MKTLFTYFVAFLITVSLFAQSPEKMSYQCVIRNVGGALVSNQNVGLRISIVQGTASGTVVYSETYNPDPQTNANGLVTVEIGSGTPVSGIFSNINWTSGPYFLRTETDPTGGTSYTIAGTSQLLSVPYALYAKTAENGSLWLRNNPNIYFNTGRVGIGTSDPGGLLELYTNSSISYPHLLLTESEGDYSRLMFKNTAAATKNWAIAGRSNSTDGDSRLNFWYWNGSTGEDIMSITGDGTVGIGTTDPGTLLQVHSNTTYTNGITPIIRISDNFKSWNIGLGDTGDRFSIASDNYAERFTVLKSNGNVGIGPVSPQYKLDVAGNLNIINGRYGDALWCNGSQALWYDGTYFSWGYGGTYNYFARPITIGNVTNPTGYALWVQGNAWSTGAFLSSDARYKKNISTIDSSLDKLMKIRGASFEFRTDEFKDYQFAKGIQFGFIAQELEEVFPEVVKTESNGYKSVNYSSMIPVLLEAIKAQQNQIDELKKEVTFLKSR